MSDSELNAPQAEAVAHVNGPLLVFAGAGSGKTRVITYRIANLVACARVPPYRILAVTFTNKAAGEMRGRLERLLGDEIARDLWVGTFHATCAKLLRAHGHAIGIDKNFTIYDSSDQKAVMTRVLRELDYDEKRYPPKAVLERVHKEKQEGRGPDEMGLDSYMDDAIQKAYTNYEAALRAANAVDFEDLILDVVRILERDGDAGGEGERMRRRFEYILVDEFQDTNAMQYRLLRQLAKHHHNLCVVGDDDQSIYRWRGADVRNIRGYKKDFPDAGVVKLEENYRSTSNIVRAALGVIAPSREREPKELFTSNEAGALVDVVGVATEREEAALVVGAIRDARDAGIDVRDIAVFYRINAQSRVLEEALRANDLPYQIVGGMKFYERAEVKDALSYLRLLANPKSDVDLLRIVNSPARGIGGTTTERLAAWASVHDVSLFDALGRVGEIEDLAAAAKKKLAAFRDLMRGLREGVAGRAPSAVLEDVLAKTGYTKALEIENSAEADARIENLRELGGSLRDYEAEAHAAGQPATLESFLERVSLQADVDAMKDAPRVTLMTVHSAKGLEFEVVLLTGMEEEMFPYKGMSPGRDDDVEEERRLAYVAITRARKRLVITHTSTRQIFGTTRYGVPSRFLRDIPADVVRHVGFGRPPSERFVDRGAPTSSRAPWRHPQRPPADHARAPGERYVDSEFFGDDAPTDEGGLGALRRGSIVVHERFGNGEVRRVDTSGEPAVVAVFPGWGEKKILAKFLKRA
jgi:DNA helicase-2/ATP-dependent DNA helicase PcrA